MRKRTGSTVRDVMAIAMLLAATAAACRGDDGGEEPAAPDTGEEPQAATVTPAAFVAAPSGPDFTPMAPARVTIDEFDYVEEEWFLEGQEDGRDYRTTVIVRLPSDPSRFSGTVVVEPLHFSGIGPMWIYTAPYLMRSGHGYAMVSSQADSLDQILRPSDPERYSSLHIASPQVDRVAVDGNNAADVDPETLASVWEAMAANNRASSSILAQAGAAIRADDGPFSGVDHVVLAGHSQTGFVVTNYIREAHDTLRLGGGRPVYDGYFPAGFPSEPFHDVDVPVVQTISEGDVANPSQSFTYRYDDRAYRRDDSDAPDDRFRLYEIAGMPHSGTRYEPYSSTALWNGQTNGLVTMDMHMSSLPHGEVFSALLDHLLAWVVDGTTPPRAPRLVVGDDGYFATDEHGNTLGGVRTVQMDVPTSRHHPDVPRPDGRIGFTSVGTEEPFTSAELRRLYGDGASYQQQFEARLDELVEEGWFLPEDVGLIAADGREEF